jgi:phospholipid/cholesterol/gamma-HCH transport system permease protein
MATNAAKLNQINDGLKQFISKTQDFYLIALNGLAGFFRRPLYFRDILEQMEYAGYGTFPIILLLSLFVGMALSLQISAELSVLGMQIYTGRIVGIATISEIGPVLSAVVYAGRTGSGMASELGSMVLRNQVDTLRVFGLDPMKKLVTPRIAASLVMLPALTLIGDLITLLGGAYIVTSVGHQSAAVYWSSIRLIMLPQYLLPGTIKPFVFGFLIAATGCYTGLSTHGGAVGLKSATTRAFVFSTILIIIFDFVITKSILIWLGYGV